MTLPDPVKSFCYEASELVHGTSRTPWGFITSDPRFPSIRDANNATVLEVAPELTIEDIDGLLVLELAAVGARHHHVEVWETSVESPALRYMRRNHALTRPDVVMMSRDTAEQEDAPPGVVVREVADPPDDFWPWIRASLNEFGAIHQDDVLDQMIDRTRTVFVPAGMRWFVGSVEGERAGYTSLLSLGGVGYLDNVVTMPPFRGRGVGAATVGAAVAAARSGRDRAVFLLTEEDNPARRLYERLGFRTRASVESFARPFEADWLPRT